MPVMIQYPGGEGTRGHESISRPRAPYLRPRVPFETTFSRDVAQK